jgi:hypothetical protein
MVMLFKGSLLLLQVINFREIAFKKLNRHPEFISGSLMQVDTGKVCNKKVADLVGVNILWDAEINSA